MTRPREPEASPDEAASRLDRAGPRDGSPAQSPATEMRPAESEPSAATAPEQRLAATPSQRGAGTLAVDKPRMLVPALLFLATTFSVLMSGAMWELPEGEPFTWFGTLRYIHRGWTLAVPLLAILVTHELGHYIAARLHRVPASLPHFIPIPFPTFSPFGTMGAVIAMRGRIASRNALLDIGAAGPLAGIVVAIPVLVIGLAGSEVKEVTGHGLMEGQCLLYLAIKRVVLGPIPPGHDVFLTPTAFAGWAGLLITVLNLIPIGQLDGGHVAYALFGERHNRVAPFLHGSLIAVFVYNLWMYRDPVPGMVWLVWFVLLYVFRRMSRVNHPPTDPGPLSPGRRVVAVVCMILFVLLFMPTPLRAY